MRIALIGAVAIVSSSAAQAAVTGPMWPPPGGNDFTGAGISAGHAGGITFDIFDHDPSDIAVGMYYGKSSAVPVEAAMDGAVDSPGEILTFSGFSGNVATWLGSSRIFLNNGVGGFDPQPIDVRFTMTMTDFANVPINFLDPATVDPGFPVGADAVIQVTGDVRTNWLFEAFFGGSWQAVNPLFDSLDTDPSTSTRTSFGSGYYLLPTPGTAALLGLAGLVTTRRRRAG